MSLKIATIFAFTVFSLSLARYPGFFPDLTCHPDFDQTNAEKFHEECRKIYKDTPNPSSRQGCSRICMLRQYRITKTQGKSLEFEMDRKAVITLDVYLNRNEELAKTLFLKMKDQCQKEVDIINEQGTSCDKWESFYDCINNAVKCD